MLPGAVLEACLFSGLYRMWALACAWQGRGVRGNWGNMLLRCSGGGEGITTWLHISRLIVAGPEARVPRALSPPMQMKGVYREFLHLPQHCLTCLNPIQLWVFRLLYARLQFIRSKLNHMLWHQFMGNCKPHFPVRQSHLLWHDGKNDIFLQTSASF